MGFLFLLFFTFLVIVFLILALISAGHAEVKIAIESYAVIPSRGNSIVSELGYNYAFPKNCVTIS